MIAINYYCVLVTLLYVTSNIITSGLLCASTKSATTTKIIITATESIEITPSTTSSQITATIAANTPLPTTTTSIAASKITIAAPASTIKFSSGHDKKINIFHNEKISTGLITKLTNTSKNFTHVSLIFTISVVFIVIFSLLIIYRIIVIQNKIVQENKNGPIK